MYTNFDFSDVLPSAIDIIQKSRDELNKYSDREAESGASNSSRIHDLLDIENARARLSVSLENQEERILNLQTSLEDFSSQFSKSLDPLTERFQQALSSYDEHFRYLEEKRDQVDDLVGLLGGKAVAGSYETNALEEQRTANNLRWGSIAFMVLILGVVGYSFIEATTAGFNLQNSVLRLVYSLLLSVPAAYLARESSKHRQQQYMHLQTALDLKAITPYIASLPPDIQNKLKEEMASKIFTPRTFDHLTKESYPINTQELVLALLSKIETKESVKKDRKEEKEKA
jgi:hypothetical protein